MNEQDLTTIEQDIINQDPEAYWERYVKTNPPIDNILIVDVSKIFNGQVWQKIIDLPGAAIERFEEAIEHIEGNKNKNLRVRFINVPQRRSIRNLRHKDAKKLLSIKCLVKRMTQVDSKILSAYFQCEAGHSQEIVPVNDVITKPTYCDSPNCKSRKFKAISTRHKRVDRQFLYVQEQLEDLEGAVQPASLRCEVIEDLCNVVTVGDRVTLNGILRLRPRLKNGEMTSAEEHSFEVNSIEVSAKEFDSVRISDAEEIEIRELAAQPGIFKKISSSIATSILGMELVKSVIALLLFGGNSVVMPDGSTIRGEINALIVSDPGMAKTQLLKFASRIAPRGVFANATTSSKVGLVASVQKDETTGQYCIEAGAFMLASGGVLCLDEMSELNKEDTKMLNEAMENGEAHINKAGINTTVRTKAAMLAACNPEKGRFVEGTPLQDQLQIDKSVLSRFDIVVLLRDFASKENDTKTAEFIMKSRMAAVTGEPDSSVITPELLRKYIALARRLNPVLTQEAATILTGFYVDTRPAGEKDETIAITTRQVPSLIRLAEAHARIRLSDTVTEEDANIAVEILKRSLYGVAFDIETGKIDEDRITKTVCKQSRNFKDVLLNMVVSICNNNQGYAKEDIINEGMSLKGYELAKVRDGLIGMSREGILIQKKPGVWSVM